MSGWMPRILRISMTITRTDLDYVEFTSYDDFDDYGYFAFEILTEI